ncbi:phage recombination protein Bet, partial [mine drainage metagenome]
PSEAEVGWSVYRGHGHYLCAGCGRPVPESSTEPVYVLEERSGFRARRVEPDCFKRAREEAWLSPIPTDHLRVASPLPAKETPIRLAPVIGTRSRGQTSEDKVAILRSAGRFPSDATAEEIAFGLEVARLIGLDPWLGQVKFLRFDPADKIHPFVGIDGMRAVAERSGKYDGREIEVEMVKGPDGSEKLLRAVCRVHRKDWSRPLVEEVRFDEAVRKRRDGQPTRPWVEMPVTMLRKTAEERALRAAFPVQLSGVYGEEEAPAAGTG